MWRAIPVAVLLAAAVTACSGDDSSADQASSNDDPVVRATGTATASGSASGSTSSSTSAPSGGAQSPGATSTSTPGRPAPPDLAGAVRAFSTAYLAGDGAKAYQMLSARCRKKTTAVQVTGEAAQLNEQFGRQDILDVTVDALSADRARVTYRYRVPALDQEREPWVRESGSWRRDEC